MTNARLRAVAVLCGAMGLTVGGAAQVAEPAVVSADADLMTVKIPGTVVTVDLARVPLANGERLWVSTTEVTWDLYDVYLYALDVPEGDADAEAVTRPSKPYVPPDRGMGRAGYPAIGMTRHAAESFCDWFQEKTGLAARLPTADEFGQLAGFDPETPMAEAAWTAANSGNTTHPVGTRSPNGFGLYDTLGNVAEWVAGEGAPHAMGGSYRDPDESCAPTSTQRQARSWNQSDPQIPKSRWWLADCSWVGFRIVIEEPNDE